MIFELLQDVLQTQWRLESADICISDLQLRQDLASLTPVGSSRFLTNKSQDHHLPHFGIPIAYQSPDFFQKCKTLQIHQLSQFIINLKLATKLGKGELNDKNDTDRKS